MIDDVVAFFAARLAEDEAIAQDAGRGDGEWTQGTEVVGWDGAALVEIRTPNGSLVDQQGETVVYDEGRPRWTEARHMARHDPDRALRGVKAKRRILDDFIAAASELEHAIVRARTTSGRGDELGERDDRERVIRKRVKYATLGRVVEDLIAEWSTHPEYRTEWPQ